MREGERRKGGSGKGGKEGEGKGGGHKLERRWSVILMGSGCHMALLMGSQVVAQKSVVSDCKNFPCSYIEGPWMLISIQQIALLSVLR